MEKIEAALARFQVPGSFVKRLSQGQKRRAALARLRLSESVPRKARLELYQLQSAFSASAESAARSRIAILTDVNGSGD